MKHPKGKHISDMLFAQATETNPFRVGFVTYFIGGSILMLICALYMALQCSQLIIPIIEASK